MTRACVVHGAGDLRVEEVPDQRPGEAEVEVAVGYGGICGSDLHYWRHGAVGDFQVREPMVLGHEVAGTVTALGDGVDGPEPGTPVAIHPATVCGTCRRVPRRKGEPVPQRALPRQRRALPARAGRFPPAHGHTRRSGASPSGRPHVGAGRGRRTVLGRPARRLPRRRGRGQAGARHGGWSDRVPRHGRRPRPRSRGDRRHRPAGRAARGGPGARRHRHLQGRRSGGERGPKSSTSPSRPRAPRRRSAPACAASPAAGRWCRSGCSHPGRCPSSATSSSPGASTCTGLSASTGSSTKRWISWPTGWTCRRSSAPPCRWMQAAEAFELAADRSRASKVLLDLEADSQS